MKGPAADASADEDLKNQGLSGASIVSPAVSSSSSTAAAASTRTPHIPDRAPDHKDVTGTPPAD